MDKHELTQARAFSFAGIVALSVAASATSLRNGYALDDIALIADNARVHTLDAWWQLFALPYWPPRFGPSLYRPLVALGYAVQWTAGHGAPWVFHLASIGLYAAACALVLGLFRALLPPLAALVAAALFAVHAVHVEAVGNVVGQSELVAAIAMLGAAVLYARHRGASAGSTGAVDRPLVAAIVTLYAVACLAKEHALLLPALLLVLEWFAVPTGGGSRVRALAPLYTALAIAAVAYVAMRTMTLGSVLGEQHLVPVRGAARVLVLLAVAPHWVRLLTWPAHLSADYSPQHIAIPTGFDLHAVLGLVVIAVIGALFFALGRGSEATRGERDAARLGIAWVAITLLPVSNLFSVMLVAERTLFLPSVGAMLVVGAAISAIARRATSAGRARTTHMMLAACSAVLVLLGVTRSRERQRVWRDSATLITQTVEDAPLSYRAQFFYGELLFDRGMRAEGERHLKLAITLNPTPFDVSPLNYLATQYRDAGMCVQALPLYERALANDPQRPDVRYGLAACLLQMGRLSDARRLAKEGVQRGSLKALFLELLARADSVGARRG